MGDNYEIGFGFVPAGLFLLSIASPVVLLFVIPLDLQQADHIAHIPPVPPINIPPNMQILWPVLLIGVQILPKVGIGRLQALHNLGGRLLIPPPTEVEVDAPPGKHRQSKQNDPIRLNAQSR